MRRARMPSSQRKHAATLLLTWSCLALADAAVMQDPQATGYRFPAHKRTFARDYGPEFAIFPTNKQRTEAALAEVQAELNSTFAADEDMDNLTDVQYSEKVVNETFQYMEKTVEAARVASADPKNRHSSTVTCGMLWDRYDRWASTLQSPPEKLEVREHMVGWEGHGLGNRSAPRLEPAGFPYTYADGEKRKWGCEPPSVEDYGAEEHADVLIEREMVLGKESDDRRRTTFREIAHGGALGAPSVLVTLDGDTLVAWHAMRSYSLVRGPDHDGTAKDAEEGVPLRRRQLLARANAPGSQFSAFDRARRVHDASNDSEFGIWLSRRRAKAAGLADPACVGARARGPRCEGALWSLPELIARVIEPAMFDEPHWNPVLFQPPPKDRMNGDAPIWLFFHVGRNRDRYATFYTRSFDGGKTWDKTPTRLGGHSVHGIGPNRHAPISVPWRGTPFWVFGASADPTPADERGEHGGIRGWSAFGFTHDEGMSWSVVSGRISGEVPQGTVLPTTTDSADQRATTVREREASAAAEAPRAPARHSHGAPAAPARRQLLRKKRRAPQPLDPDRNAIPRGGVASEPALFEMPNGLVGAALRDNLGFIYLAVNYNASRAYEASRAMAGEPMPAQGSMAGGQTVIRTELRSNTAGVAAVTLLGQRLLVVAHNPVQSTHEGMSREAWIRTVNAAQPPPAAPREDLRYPMRLSLSFDMGNHFPCYLDIDTRPGEYSSPSMASWSHDRVRTGAAALVAEDRRGAGFSLVYQWRRRDIAHVELTAERLLDLARCEEACLGIDAQRGEVCSDFYTKKREHENAENTGISLQASTHMTARAKNAKSHDNDADGAPSSPRKSSWSLFGR